jgi:hypothetical protein
MLAETAARGGTVLSIAGETAFGILGEDVMRLETLVAAMLVLSQMSLLSQAEDRDPIRSGDYKGGAHYEEGKFKGCYMWAPNSGAILAVAALPDPNDPWNVGLVRESWHLEVGAAFPVDLTFDGQALFHVYGEPENETSLAIHMPGKAIAERLFQAKTMSTFLMGQQYNFSLEGVSKLQPLLLRCLNAHKTPDSAE